MGDHTESEVKVWTCQEMLKCAIKTQFTPHILLSLTYKLFLIISNLEKNSEMFWILFYFSWSSTTATQLKKWLNWYEIPFPAFCRSRALEAGWLCWFTQLMRGAERWKLVLVEYDDCTILFTWVRVSRKRKSIFLIYSYV